MRNAKFLMVPIMHDGSDGPVADVTEMWKKFRPEQRQ
jgi:hypothetical protein